VKKNVHPLLNEPQTLRIYSADIPSEQFFVEQVADYEINKSFLFNIYGITYSCCLIFFAVTIDN
jgi:hypothetical protein